MFARVGCEEVGEVTEVTIPLGAKRLTLAQGKHVIDAYVVIIFGMKGQCLFRQSRRSGGIGHHHAVAVVDALDGLLDGGELAVV